MAEDTGQPWLTIDPMALTNPAPTICPDQLVRQPEQGLGSKLRAAIQSHSGSVTTSKPFIPLSEYEALITSEAIAKDLQYIAGLSDEQQSSTVNQILGIDQTRSFVKVFATLAIIGRQDRIFQFLNSNADDNILPITISDDSSTDSPVVFSNNESAMPLTCFQGWTFADIEAFEENMWLYLSPVFLPPTGATLTELLQFPSKTPFPFVEDASTRIPDRRGGSSTVINVNIHPAHHKLNDEQNSSPSFAVKRLSPSRKHEWKREIETLRKFSENPSSNLVPLMAAWQHDDKFFLLFPWAKTDLRSWWRSNHQTLPIEQTRWLLSLCLDVSAGLEAFHQISSGYHGDIKPENILWFPDGQSQQSGRWKIADFGLSHLDDKADGTKALERYGCTPCYRPPEYDSKDKPMGQKADVWSLGCVFVESAIWSALGTAGLQNFQTERFLNDQGSQSGDGAFWRSSDQGPVLRPLVIKWLANLKERCESEVGFQSGGNSMVSMCLDDMLVLESCDRKPIIDVAEQLRSLQAVMNSTPHASLSTEHSLSVPFLNHVSTGSSVAPNDSSTIFSSPLLADCFTTSDIPWADQLQSLLSCPTDLTSSTINPACPKPQHDNSAWKESTGTPTDSERTGRGYATSLGHSVAADHALEADGGKEKRRAREGPSGKRAAKARKMSPSTRFACPFHKYDPATFGIHDARWRTCVGPGWTSVHRVKEHIDRKHAIPPNTCMRCLKSFSSDKILKDHHKSEPPCEPHHCGKVDHRVSECARAQMRRRPKGRSDVQAWGDIYRIIFDLGKDDTVPSPYCDQSVDSPLSSGSAQSPPCPDSSFAKFEDYLRNTLLPTADEATTAKIRGYFELSETFRYHESRCTSSPELEVGIPSQREPLMHCPAALGPNDSSHLSSVPTLVTDEGPMHSAADMFSTVATVASDMPPPTLDKARSRCGRLDGKALQQTPDYLDEQSAKGGSGSKALSDSILSWDPSTLTEEDDALTRMLFNDLDEHNGLIGI